MTTHRVMPADTAVALGSGDVEVLGTPRLLAWLEAATVAAAAPELAEGETSVGTSITLRHSRPSPVGATVEVSAALAAGTTARRLVFDVHASDGSGATVADGRIERAVVVRDGFAGTPM